MKIQKIDNLALLQSKLNYYRKIDLPNFTIVEFWRVKKEEGKNNTPKTKDAAKEMAFITLDKSEKFFKVSYYPLDGNIQVVDNLTMDKLPEMIETLKQAGF